MTSSATSHRRPSALMLAILTLGSTSAHGVMVGDLIAACGESRPSVSRSLRRLARRGAINLHRPALRRRLHGRFYAKRITVTAQGRELLAANKVPPSGSC